MNWLRRLLGITTSDAEPALGATASIAAPVPSSTTSNAEPAYNSLVFLGYNHWEPADSRFQVIYNVCLKLAGLTHELDGTVIELREPQTGAFLCVKAKNEDRLNVACLLLGALDIYGHEPPEAALERGTKRFVFLDELLSRGSTLAKEFTCDQLPPAKPSGCPVCKGKGRILFGTPHKDARTTLDQRLPTEKVIPLRQGWVNVECPFCGGRGNLGASDTKPAE